MSPVIRYKYRRHEERIYAPRMDEMGALSHRIGQLLTNPELYRFSANRAVNKDFWELEWIERVKEEG